MKQLCRLIWILLLCLSIDAAAQQPVSTKGRDFWMGFLNNIAVDPSDKLQLFIVSDVPTSGQVSIPGQAWNQAFSVAPNTVTEITIPNAIGETVIGDLVQAKGVHITSLDSVSVFAINFSNASADATKVLPTGTLGTKYIVTSYAGNSFGQSEAMIVATDDNTEVSIIPSCNTGGGNLAGVPFTVTLNAGQVYMLTSSTGLDLTGTRIESTAQSGGCRPFAVFGGSGCAMIPSSCGNCDHLFEQLLPVDTWGFEYYLAPILFEVLPATGIDTPSYTYRVIASENDTEVTIDGLSSINLDAGEYHEFNDVQGAHCLLSDKSISVVQFMQGVLCSGNGDPSMLVLDDAEKKINNITFSTINSSVITTHFLNVVVRSEDIGTVSLDGVALSASLFQPFPGCGSHMWVNIAIDAGTHNLYAPNGVNGYVYGLHESESYAYSVGSYKPTPPINYQEAFCGDNQVTLSVSNAYYNPQWFNTNDLNTVIAQGYTLTLTPPISSAVYVAVADENVSGCSQSFYYSVESMIPPAFQITPSESQYICRHESVQLDVLPENEQGTYLYSWTPSLGLSDPTARNPIATPYSTTTYSVTVSTPTGCASATQSITIHVQPGNISYFEMHASDDAICAGENLVIDVNTESIIWSDNFDPNISLGDWVDINNGSASSACGSVEGTALYFNGSGERSAITNAVNVSQGGTIYFSIKIADGVAPCDNAEPGDNVELRYSLDGVNFPASNTILVLYESAYPEFTSLAVDIPVAAQSAATYFKWIQVGAFTNNQDNWVLDEVYIGALNSSGFSFNWSSPETLTFNDPMLVTAAPTTDTNYILELTDSNTGCVYSDSIFVAVGEEFNLTYSEEVLKCGDDPVQLLVNPEPPGDYLFTWNSSNGTINNSFIESPEVNPTSSEQFTAEVTSDFGCVKSATLEVLVSSISSVVLSYSAEPVCANETVNIELNVAATTNDYQINWTSSEDFSESANGLSITTTPVGTADYEVVVTDNATGCIYEEIASISVVPTPEIQLLESDIVTCDAVGTTIHANTSYPGPVEWNWSPSEWVTDATSSVTALAGSNSGSLTVTLTNDHGCSSSEEINITVLTEATELGGDLSVCGTAPITLDTGWPSDYSVSWSHGPNTHSVEITESGIYSVEVLSPLGCYSADTISIEFKEIPVIDLGPEIAKCPSETIALTGGNSDYTYLWSTGATGLSIQVYEPGVYGVTASNGECESTDDISVVEHPMPENPFPQLEYTTCFEFTPYHFELDAANEGALYEWEDGTDGQVYFANAPGEYTVEITTAFGCKEQFRALIQEECPGALYVPSAFTPDGDGLNDVWKVEGSNIVKYRLQLWSRWGELIYETDDIDGAWVGNRKGGEMYLERGVFNYLITYTVIDGDKGESPEMQKRGSVVLIR